MGKKIDWFNGKNALNDYDMQEICDQIANADTPQNLAEVIKGSETVVVDVSEDNKYLEIHLDAGGTKLYQHFVKLGASNPKGDSPIAVILNRSTDVFTIDTLASYLYTSGFTGSLSMTYPVSTRVASPMFTSNENAAAILGVLSDNGSTLKIKTAPITAFTKDDGTIGTTAGGSALTYDVRSVTDTLIEL